MQEQAARASGGGGAAGKPIREFNSPQTRASRPLREPDFWASADGERAVRDFAAGSAPDRLAAPQRTTIVIRGQVADRHSPGRRPSRSLPGQGSYGRMRMRPEWLALWAVLLGCALVVAALANAHM